MLSQLAKFRRLTRYHFPPNGLHPLVWYRLREETWLSQLCLDNR